MMWWWRFTYIHTHNRMLKWTSVSLSFGQSSYGQEHFTGGTRPLMQDLQKRGSKIAIINLLPPWGLRLRGYGESYQWNEKMPSPHFSGEKLEGRVQEGKISSFYESSGFLLFQHTSSTKLAVLTQRVEITGINSWHGIGFSIPRCRSTWCPWEIYHWTK